MKNERETEENPFKPPTPPLYAPTDPALSAKIFFPAAAGDALLIAEDQMIFKSSELPNRAKQILQKLQEGPHSDQMLPALPKDAKLQDIFISEEGTAFVHGFQGQYGREQAAFGERLLAGGDVAVLLHELMY